jgi:amidase
VDGRPPVVGRDAPAYAWDAAITPRLVVRPPTTVVFETLDARAGALDDRHVGDPFELPPPAARVNPLTGPVAVEGAAPGDTLRVRIDAIELDRVGWTGGHVHIGPLAPGRVPRAIGQRIAVEGGRARFLERFSLPVRPMVGCLGVAPPAGPDGPPASTRVGRFGGNLDHPVIGVGATVHLPVVVPGALLFLGDVHASQGDGELSMTALEIGARVTVTLEVRPARALRWPWVTFGDRLAVLTSDDDFTVARRHAADAMVAALEAAYGLEPAEALALVSLAGDLRIGQAGGHGPMTLRLEVPRWEGLEPV